MFKSIHPGHTKFPFLKKVGEGDYYHLMHPIMIVKTTLICVTKTTKIYVVRAMAQREANVESRAKLSVFPVNSFKMVPGYHRFGRI